MSVAMVAACPFPAPRGSQVLIAHLAEALIAHGDRVHLVCYSAGESPNPALRIHPVLQKHSEKRSFRKTWFKVVLDLRMIWQLLRVVRREDVDVIHSHNYEAPIVAYIVRWLTGVPVVYHAHNTMSDELPHHFPKGWMRPLIGWIAWGFGRPNSPAG